MKRVIAKCYFDKAKQMYPNEKNKTRLMDIAEILKMTMNSHYGKVHKEEQPTCAIAMRHSSLCCRQQLSGGENRH